MMYSMGSDKIDRLVKVQLWFFDIAVMTVFAVCSLLTLRSRHFMSVYIHISAVLY